MADARSILQPEHRREVDSARKVPFLELHDGRLQGVVSSKSSHERVYVSFLEAETGDYYCSTNNNRQCGGLSRSSCKHIGSLFSAAVSRHGRDRVLTYLGIGEDERDGIRGASSIVRHLGGSQREEKAGEVFSRFLDHLRYLEVEGTNEPMPEMSWFVS